MHFLLLVHLLGAVAVRWTGSPAPLHTASGSETRTINEVLAHVGKKAGVKLLADSTLLHERAAMPAPDAAITADTVEQYIKDLVKTLPQGATWAKLYLPPAPAGKEWTGDEVIAYAMAQVRLYGVAGVPGSDGSIEILSQRLPADKGKSVIETLNLKPVYVLTLGRGGFSGIWSSTYGEMRLRQSGNRVHGTYTFQDGEIEGVVQGDTMRFRWIEHGSGALGEGYFTLSPNGDSFEGRWSYAESPDSVSSWTGERLRR